MGNTIFERRAVGELGMISDPNTYRDWSKTFKNAFEQTHTSSRSVLPFVEALNEGEIEKHYSPSRHDGKFEVIRETYIGARLEGSH